MTYSFPNSMPYDTFTVIDNTAYEDNTPVEINGTPNGPIAYIPFVSPRGYGDDNKLAYMTSDMLAKFGTPNLQKYGLSLYLANRFLAGGGSVLGMRVVPGFVAATKTTPAHGKSYANSCVFAVVKNKTDKFLHYTRVSSTTAGALEVVADTVTPTATQVKKSVVLVDIGDIAVGEYVIQTRAEEHRVRYCVKSFDADGVDVESKFATATAEELGVNLGNDEVIYKLFIIRSCGAGDYANLFKYQVFKDDAMNSTTRDAFFYKFEDSDNGSTLDNNMSFTFADSYMYDGESMDPEDVFDRYSRNVKFEKVQGTVYNKYTLCDRYEKCEAAEFPATKTVVSDDATPTSSQVRRSDTGIACSVGDYVIAIPGPEGSYKIKPESGELAQTRYIKCESSRTGALHVVASNPATGEIALATVQTDIPNAKVGEYVVQIDLAWKDKADVLISCQSGDYVELDETADNSLYAFMEEIGTDGSTDFILSDTFTNTDGVTFNVSHGALDVVNRLSGAVPVWVGKFEWGNDIFAGAIAAAYGSCNTSDTVNKIIVNENVYDNNRYPFQYIIAPSYNTRVISAIYNLCQSKVFANAWYITPMAESFNSQISFWDTGAEPFKSIVGPEYKIYSPWAMARDPYSGKKTYFPSAYFNAYALPYHWIHKKGLPYAGESNFTWDIIPGTLKPVTCIPAQLIANHNAKFNTMIENGSGLAYGYEELTLAAQPSKLSDIHNSLILTDIIRICTKVSNSFRWTSFDNNNVSEYITAAQDAVKSEHASTCSNITITATRASSNGAGRQRLKCMIHIEFKNVIKGVDHIFYIDA